MVAIAPYFDIPLNDTMTNTQIFDGISARIDNFSTTVRSHAEYARARNLTLTCYEAGQGLLGTNSITTSLQIGAQTDDKMRLMYIKYY